MRVQEHVKLSTAAAFAALPWLKKDVWIPLAASVLIDVDHYLWHAVTHRTLSLRAAIKYFGQADPPRRQAARLLHQPIVLGTLLFIAIRTRSRVLLLILAGLLFHVSLDVVHATQMKSLKRSLSEQANGICPECGQECGALQLHTVHVSANLFGRYAQRNFVVLCPTCHEQVHQQRN
jgi:hypothetical protein